MGLFMPYTRNDFNGTLFNFRLAFKFERPKNVGACGKLPSCPLGGPEHNLFLPSVFFHNKLIFFFGF